MVALVVNVNHDYRRISASNYLLAIVVLVGQRNKLRLLVL
jgi:hypothetical protein